ncbi:hypothetical protein ABPG77_005230 [Micractinium sp. CCAP 211/92]
MSEATSSQPKLASLIVPRAVSFATAHSEPAPAPAGSGAALPAKSKALAVRKWLAVNADGELRHLELAKLRVTHYLGVQLRDLRLLDPQLATSYPSAILARERAIVVNLEFIKCIISMDYVYITNLEDPSTQSFVEELQRRLRSPAGSSSFLSALQPSSASFAGAQAALCTKATSCSMRAAGLFIAQCRGGRAALAALPDTTCRPPAPPPPPPAGSDPADEHAAPHTPRLSSTMAAPENLPFELRVMEVALDTVARYIENMTSDLELAAHPALDALTSVINTSNLERVRRIKNRMVRLTTRVETLREVLEKFLDDDSDMKDLNLTAKEEDRMSGEERRASQGLSFDVPMPIGGMMPSIDSLPETPRPGQAGGSVSSASSASTDLEDDPAVEVVEMVMEPYFMQVDNTFNKLQTLCEYIDDTEDYIQIKLDSQRNALIRLDLVLTSFSASVALVTAITGLFAMNVMLLPDKVRSSRQHQAGHRQPWPGRGHALCRHAGAALVAPSPPLHSSSRVGPSAAPQEGQAPYSWFLAVSISTGIGAIAIFAGVMAYCRWKRLI